MSTKVCKFFIEGTCKKGEDCNFLHDSLICKFYFLKGFCKKGDDCKFKHTIKLNQKPKKKKLIKKNTECFEPSDEIPEMKIKVGLQDKYNHNDVVIVPNFFCEKDDNTIYERLLEEIKDHDIFKLWHGDTHLIADDKRKWKEECPLFNSIIEKIKNDFNMNIQATRLNWYKNSDDWKPYHHDAAAIDPKKAKVQNITVGISFGQERDAAFQHAKSKVLVSLPQPNGQAYTFGKDVNINWRHGIPQLPEEERIEGKGRISIIAWGGIN